MSDQAKRIDSWLRRVIFVDDDTEAARCARVVIRHVTSSNKQGSQISLVKIPRATTRDDISSLVDEIENRCMTDAEGLDGQQRYLLSPVSDKGEAISERLTLRYTFETSDGDELDSEPNTAKGLTTQLMRHNEIGFRSTIGAMNGIMNILQRTVSRQADTIERLMDGRDNEVKVREDLLSQKHERDLMAKRESAELDMRTDLKDKAMLLLPAVANKLLGRNVLAQKVSTGEAMLMSLLETLSPEQFAKLQDVLTPEQTMVIVEMMQDYQARNAKPAANGEAKE